MKFRVKERLISLTGSLSKVVPSPAGEYVRLFVSVSNRAFIVLTRFVTKPDSSFKYLSNAYSMNPAKEMFWSAPDIRTLGVTVLGDVGWK